jgi:histidine ammonia-lyase
MTRHDAVDGAMKELLLGSRRLSADDVVSVARDCARVDISPEGRAAILAGHSALLEQIAAGRAIYGVTTGLGAAVDTRVASKDPGLQRRVPLARSVGVGGRASLEEVRAIMVARLGRLVQGYSGISPNTAEALMALINAGIHPVVPLIGSVGQADLPPLAHIASVVFGEGEVDIRGSVMAGGVALAEAGLVPPDAGPKDGLALVSSNAASVGLGALAVHDARHVLAVLLAGACLSLEAFRANLSPLCPAAVELHPVPGFDRVARRILEILAGGSLGRPGAARRLQDPLSFRCLGPVHAAALSAIDQATGIVEIELNSSDDNPAVLHPQAEILANASFDTTHLALSIEGLGLALSRAAALSGQRIMQIMSPAASDLPRFLAPPLAGRSGFSALQKTVSALVAEIQFNASPMPAVILPVADRVEDYGTMATSIVLKAREIIERLRLLGAIELIVAAQACDLRPGIVLGDRTGALYHAVRCHVPMLAEDRPVAPDIAALVEAISSEDLANVFVL